MLIVSTGYPGTSCVVPPKYEGANCIDLVLARPGQKIESHYLSRFFNSPSGKMQALSAKHGLAQQHLNVGAVKKVLVPLPSITEQIEISDTLIKVDQKIMQHESRQTIVSNLFRTLLHQLMTAQMRVNDVDLSGLGLEIEDETPQGDRHGKEAGALS